VNGAPLSIVLIATSESVGVGLIGAVVLRLLRRYPVVVPLVGVIVITVSAMVVSTVTVVSVAGPWRAQTAAELAANVVAGIVSIGIGLLLGRSVMTGSRRPADATRALGHVHQFHAPVDPPTAELAELARELTITSDKLAESRRREQATEAARRQLLAWISHDLRSPLARLRATTESMKDGVVTDLTRYRGKIRSDVDRLTDMVDDLFELSRIQAGELRLERRAGALDDLVSAAVAELDGLAGERGVLLRARRTEPIAVSVDNREMARVVNHLLVNAINYSRPGGTVSVDTRAADAWVIVSVADECGGIPEESLGSVFDMGWRGDIERDSSADRGGGLGLAIVRGIVQAHQGDVSVYNVPGGCCFEVWLPCTTPFEP
jgi:signal transduction histidine kinase